MATRRVCSDACRKARRNRIERAARPRREPITRTCKSCSVVFTTTIEAKVYHIPKCGLRHSPKGQARKRAERKMVRFRLRLYRRDPSCYLCGNAIDYSLPYPHQWSPQIDHLIPLSMGGRTEMDNLAVTHKQCNEDKGDREVGSWERATLGRIHAMAS